jgi:signal transduction histidine kinase
MTITRHPSDNGDRRRGPLRAAARWLDPVEPHPARGPLSRWPRSSDAAIAGFVFAVSLVTVTASALPDDGDFTLGAIADRPAGAVLLLGAAAVGLWWRRSHAIAVTGFTLTLMIVWAIAGYGDGQDPAMIVASYSVGRYVDDHRHSTAVAGAIALVSIVGTLIDSHQRIDIVPAIVLSALPWYVGRRVRNRGAYLSLLQDRAQRLETEQAALARQAVAEERARIARELHDVVAHRVSMMTVQAGAAKTIARHDLEPAIEAMADVERAGRQALGELRHLLGVLRPDDTDADDLGPQPGLADIEGLIEDLRQAGVDVTLETTTAPADLPAAVDLSAYRIVQEAITNIVKHGGERPKAEVRVTAVETCLEITVANTLDPDAAHLPGTGFGLAGMRERAALLGGTLTAQVEPPDRFVVRARLPIASVPT